MQQRFYEIAHITHMFYNYLVRYFSIKILANTLYTQNTAPVQTVFFKLLFYMRFCDILYLQNIHSSHSRNNKNNTKNIYSSTKT